jgi:hypothetical protein
MLLKILLTQVLSKIIGNCTNLIKMRVCNLHFAKWMHDAVEIFWQELRMEESFKIH